MEAPIDTDTDEGSEGEEEIGEVILDEEVDINIHFHCEHCVRMYRCTERPKAGWSCELGMCPNGCGQRFHQCKFEEHRHMCSHERVPCINAGFGCPLWMLRRHLSDHLPVCPASVVICNAEWNRWALGAKEREKVAMGRGTTALYNTADLDMSLALRDQELVNEMLGLPKRLRNTMCNKITRRFPALPLTVHGSRYEGEVPGPGKLSRQSTEEEDDGLAPGKKIPEKNDDISALCCVHGILKNLCNLCRADPEPPPFKMGKVWRERASTKKPGVVEWRQEPVIEKVRRRDPRGKYAYIRPVDTDEDDEDELTELSMVVDEQGRPLGRARFKTPPPAPLTSRALTMELPLKHYSRHQPKPRAMFTFQCMQEVRRSEYTSHYQNCHSEIQEGLDGWIIHRCPLHVIGCPYVNNRLHPGAKDADIVYCPVQHSFGIRPALEHEPSPCGGLPRSRSPSVEKTTSSLGQLGLKHRGMRAIPEHPSTSERQYYTSSVNLTYLPVEVLLYIATFLDGFSLNNLSMTCRLMRDVCVTLLNDRGLVITEWVRQVEGGKVRWREGRRKQFFSKSFTYVDRWSFKNVPHMGNHLEVCPFNKRGLADKKFAYVTENQGIKKTLRRVRY